MACDGGDLRSRLAAADADQRRELLAKSGIRLSAAITGVEGKRSPTNMGAFQFHLFVPEEIASHVVRQSS